MTSKILLRPCISKLLSASTSLFLVVLPPATAVTALLVALQIAYNACPTCAKRPASSIEWAIIDEQVARSLENKAELAFLGDSSCLMGVAPSKLPKELGTADSFCTIAYMGPSGYAAMLDNMLSSDAAPEKLVLVFSSAQFHLDATWRSYSNSELYDDQNEPKKPFPEGGFAYLRMVMENAIYRPLPGAFGKFYGGEQQLKEYIRNHSGSAIDPNVSTGGFSTSRFIFSHEYLSDVAVLRDSLSSYGPEKVLLAFSPIPMSNWDPQMETEREDAAASLIDALGLPPNHFLDTVPALPDERFASSNHLTPEGQSAFTFSLGRALILK